MTCKLCIQQPTTQTPSLNTSKAPTNLFSANPTQLTKTDMPTETEDTSTSSPSQLTDTLTQSMETDMPPESKGSRNVPLGAMLLPMLLLV